jgi:heterodisulfide reductase subunit A-like polyferredoxin
VDCGELVDFAKQFDDVVVSKTHSFLCTESGQNEIMNDIQEKNITRVVASA